MASAIVRDPAFGGSKGFTLTESLVVLGIVTLTIAIGIPSFATLVQGNRIVTAVNELTAHLHFARTYAITHEQEVMLCPSVDRTQCLAFPDWHRGWLVFADLNGNHQRDPNEEVLTSHGQLVGVTLRSTSGRRKIRFQPLGSAGGSNTTFTACDRRARSSPRALILHTTGRVRESGRRPDGRPLHCTFQ